jgi:IS30 family transposase
MKSYTHLQPEELSVICALRKLGLSCTAIAVQLRRAPSTVSRELGRMALPTPMAPVTLQAVPTTPMRAPYTVRAAKRDRAQKRRASACNARRWHRDDPGFEAIEPRLTEQHSLAKRWEDCAVSVKP